MIILKIMYDMCFIKYLKCKKKVYLIEILLNYDWWIFVYFFVVLVSGWRLILVVLIKFLLFCDLDFVCLLFFLILIKCMVWVLKLWDRFYKIDYDV